MNAAPRRIGVNAIFLEPGMGGLETYVVEVVPRLARQAPDSEIVVFANTAGAALLRGLGLPRNVRIAESRAMGRRGLRAVSELTALGLVASARCDVLLNVALTAPFATRAANVVLLADVTWMIFPDLGDGQSSTLRLWRAIVPRVARRADRVIALTNSGAAAIADALSVPPDRIDVVPLGRGSGAIGVPTPESELRRGLDVGDGPIVLNVAAKKAHKNLLRLIEAFALAHRAVPDATLVLPGAPTDYEQRLRERAGQLGLGPAVAFPGFVSADDLEGLYAAAACFVFPSANEGFGLPVLEAMARGIPVACAQASALPEVAGAAALYFDPEDTAAMASAMRRILDDDALADRLRADGRAQAARFSWDRCARETLDVLARAAADRGRT